MQQRDPDQVQERGAQLQPARGEHVGQRHLHKLPATGPNTDYQHQHTHSFEKISSRYILLIYAMFIFTLF